MVTYWSTLSRYISHPFRLLLVFPDHFENSSSSACKLFYFIHFLEELSSLIVLFIQLILFKVFLFLFFTVFHALDLACLYIVVHVVLLGFATFVVGSFLSFSSLLLMCFLLPTVLIGCPDWFPYCINIKKETRTSKDVLFKIKFFLKRFSFSR